MTDIHSCSYHCDRPECIKAQRDELRERLAQPEQGGKTGWPAGMLQDDSRELSKSLASKPDAKRHAREAAQPAPPPEQDVPEASCGNMGPVGWLESPDGAFRANPLYKIKFPSKLLSWQVSLYTSPQQREWQRLTDKEREEATGWSVEHIEAKLKEKNT